jgi:hypothetical protein
LFTKPLAKNRFEALRETIGIWSFGSKEECWSYGTKVGTMLLSCGLLHCYIFVNGSMILMLISMFFNSLKLNLSRISLVSYITS